MATTTMWEASLGVESRPHMKEKTYEHSVGVHRKRWALSDTMEAENNQPEGKMWTGPPPPHE